MDKMQDFRDEINELDKQISDLFQKRMSVVKNIAMYKIKNNKPIFDKAREEIVLNENVNNINDEQLKRYYKKFIKNVMQVSKEYQYDIQSEISKEKIHVNLGENGYDIIIKQGCISEISRYISLDRKVMVVTDIGVPPEFYETIKNSCNENNFYLEIIPNGETSKSTQICEGLINSLMMGSFSRGDLIIALGGGVVGDVTGFVASCYKRGLDFVNIPTTTLSQIDSSVGGKTAINLHNVKNVVGSFYQPKLVLIDINVLETLPERHFKNGLVEALKMGLIYDETILKYLEQDNIKENIESIIYKSVMGKKQIVELDEKDTGIRQILNFGHTIGHAIEGIYYDSILHGEAVAVGLVHMSQKEVKQRVILILDKLKIDYKIHVDKKQLFNKIIQDKKVNNDKMTIVSLEKIGKPKLVKISLVKLSEIILNSKGSFYEKYNW